MGPAILLQWSLSPPPATLTDIIISRLLEHYSLTQPQKSMVHFRTFRSNAESQPGATTRLLTTIQYSQPVSILSQERTASRDDTSYLFLEDRTRLQPQEQPAVSQTTAPGTSPTNGSGQKDSGAETTTDGSKDAKGLESDGFEIIDLPPDTPSVQPNAANTDAEGGPTAVAVPALPSLPSSALTPMARGKRGIYRILAVKPSPNVLPLLQNLLSPLVMGLTKSARAAASTTAQTSVPTPLPGTPFTLTALTFPSIPPPHPNITITVYFLASPTSSIIFLEAEWPGQHDSTLSRAVLRECLAGCVPEEMGGEKRYHEWESADKGGWEGPEKTRRMTMLLARCLREASYI